MMKYAITYEAITHIYTGDDDVMCVQYIDPIYPECLHHEWCAIGRSSSWPQKMILVPQDNDIDPRHDFEGLTAEGRRLNDRSDGLARYLDSLGYDS